MSYKIRIPNISNEYKVALKDYLLGLPKESRDDFYTHLNLISGYAQSADVSLFMSNLGGAKTIDELLDSTSGFEQATIKEFIRFHEEGYSGGDFQHIFLEAFLIIRTDMLLCGLK